MCVGHDSSPSKIWVAWKGLNSKLVKETQELGRQLVPTKASMEWFSTISSQRKEIISAVDSLNRAEFQLSVWSKQVMQRKACTITRIAKADSWMTMNNNLAILNRYLRVIYVVHVPNLLKSGQFFSAYTNMELKKKKFFAAPEVKEPMQSRIWFIVKA